MAKKAAARPGYTPAATMRRKIRLAASDSLAAKPDALSKASLQFPGEHLIALVSST
jgi:hypothetical protein